MLGCNMSAGLLQSGSVGGWNKNIKMNYAVFAHAGLIYNIRCGVINLADVL